MKVGDLVRFKPSLFCLNPGCWIVKRTEAGNNWVFLFGLDIPVQLSLMEVISESR